MLSDGRRVEVVRVGCAAEVNREGFWIGVAVGVLWEEGGKFVHCGESVPVFVGRFGVDGPEPDLDAGVVELVKILEGFQGCRAGGLGFRNGE